MSQPILYRQSFFVIDSGYPHSTLHPDKGKNWKVSNRACKDLLAVPGRLHSCWVEDDKKDSHHAIIIYGETNERYWRHCKTSFLLLLFWHQKFTKSWKDAIQYLSSYFDLQELAKICWVWFALNMHHLGYKFEIVFGEKYFNKQILMLTSYWNISSHPFCKERNFFSYSFATTEE